MARSLTQLLGAAIVMVLVPASATAAAPAHQPSHGRSAPTCATHGSAHAVASKTVHLFAQHHPTHVRLDHGEVLRVVTHDQSYRGTPYAKASPRHADQVDVLCQLHRTGSRHHKVVIFRANRHGHTTVSATPPVAPGTGTATESLRVRVVKHAGHHG